MAILRKRKEPKEKEYILNKYIYMILIIYILIIYIINNIKRNFQNIFLTYKEISSTVSNKHI